jgi:hypothetical protein
MPIPQQIVTLVTMEHIRGQEIQLILDYQPTVLLATQQMQVGDHQHSIIVLITL